MSWINYSPETARAYLAAGAAAVDERDAWIRLFNRLEGAVAHHRKQEKWCETWDEALYAAHDRVLKAASEMRTEER